MKHPCPAGLCHRPEIGFEYERFYEYFAGQRLYDLVNTPTGRPVADKVAAYADLGTQAQEKAFLWGAVKDALFLELEKRKADQGWKLFLALAAQQTSSLRRPGSAGRVCQAALARTGWCRMLTQPARSGAGQIAHNGGGALAIARRPARQLGITRKSL